MAEWFKALVLKTSVLKGTVGSNPTFTVLRGKLEESNDNRLHEYLSAVLHSRSKPLPEWGTDRRLQGVSQDLTETL